MQTWIRGDGRFFVFDATSDLFGPVVEIRYGGRHRPGRVRLIAVKDAAEASAVELSLAKRRERRGYVRDRSADTT